MSIKDHQPDAPETEQFNPPHFARILLVTGIVLLAANLRAAITSVGPLIGVLRADIGLSDGLAGLLTALPLLAFRALSPLAPGLARRWGMERTLFVSLIILAAGIAVRSLPNAFLLFLGTAALGSAIAVCNVLLPGLVKRDFPTQVGRMTGLYSGVMGVGASLASGVSVPLAQMFIFGWRTALAFWALPALLATIVWLPQLYAQRRTPSTLNDPATTTQSPLVGSPSVESPPVGSFSVGSPPLRGPARPAIWRSPLAWQITLFMGLQSFCFYAVISWLPTFLRDEGMSSTTAGWMSSLLQLTGFLSTFLTPILAGRRPDQRLFVVIFVLFDLVAFVGLLLTGSTLAPLWIILLGAGQGAYLALALLFFVLRAPDARRAAELSGMAQSLGYLLAAGGPFLFGFLHQLTHSWTPSLLMLIAFILLLLLAGLGAGRNKLVAV